MKTGVKILQFEIDIMRPILFAFVVAATASYQPPTSPPTSRRAVLAAAVPAFFAARRPSHALELRLPDGGTIALPSLRLPALPSLGLAGNPAIELLSAAPVCQGRCRDQDFIVVRYIGRRSDSGAVFDERYAKQPLVYELGSFYMPGVDDALIGACVGEKYRLTWMSSPSLGADANSLLPPGTPIEMELELLTIKYSLFGEKMRNATNTYWFNSEPLTLTSAVDARGHISSRTPVVVKDNPFSIAPGEKNIISNPSSVLGPLFRGFF